MTSDANILLSVTRIELGLITDALDLMEDCEHLRPEKQDEIATLLARIEEMTALCDMAIWETGR